MARISQTTIDELQRRLRDTESELQMARLAIVDLMPERHRELLRSGHLCLSAGDILLWPAAVAKAIIATAELLPKPRPEYEERALCPLCGGSSQTPYASGYSVPEGLRRHMVGDGRSHRCVVMTAAIESAEHWWDRTFGERTSDQRLLRERHDEARRRKEMQYQVAPYLRPLLSDEFASPRSARSAEDLQWAQERLTALGFSVMSRGKVTTCTTDIGRAVVFADPRPAGRLQFVMVGKPLPAVAPFDIAPPVPTVSFDFPDTIKHKLQEHFDRRKDAALKELPQHLRLVER